MTDIAVPVMYKLNNVMCPCLHEDIVVSVKFGVRDVDSCYLKKKYKQLQQAPCMSPVNLDSVLYIQSW